MEHILSKSKLDIIAFAGSKDIDNKSGGKKVLNNAEKVKKQKKQ